MRYYFTQLAARPLVLGNRTYRFLICNQNAGRSVGVYATEDPADIAVLDAAVASKRGVKSIEAEEYESLKKKATLTLQSPKSGGSPPKLGRPAENPALNLAMEKAGVVGAASAKTGEQGILEKPTAASLIQLRKVASPKPFSGSETKVQKAVKRADAAKVRVARPAAYG